MLVLVLPLTVLIWIYAERAQIDPKSNLQVSIDVGIASPNLFASLIEPLPGAPILIDVTGSKQRVQELETQLQSRIRLAISPNLEPDTEQTLPTISLLNDYPAIRDSGVTVTSAVPATIRVRIDSRGERRATTLRLPDNLAVAVASSSIEPATVVVTGPERVLMRLFPTDKPSLPLDLTASLDKISQPGTHRLEGVPILIDRTIPGIRVQPERASVVKIEVSAREVEHEIPSVPLEVLKPLAIDPTVVVKTNTRNVTNVRVRGPSEQIQKLMSIGGKPPEVTPFAVLRVSPGDVGQGERTKAVVIDGLPDGVVLTGQPPQVEFSVTPARAME